MSTGSKDKDQAYLMLGMRIIGEFGAIIAVPVVLLTLLGKWLDGKYDTTPRYLIAGFVVAAVVSTVSITHKAKEFGRRYQEIDKDQEA